MSKNKLSLRPQSVATPSPVTSLGQFHTGLAEIVAMAEQAGQDQIAQYAEQMLDVLLASGRDALLKLTLVAVATVAKCSGCGEGLDSANDPRWRFNGSTWEHQCGDPQAGYFPVAS